MTSRVDEGGEGRDTTAGPEVTGGTEEGGDSAAGPEVTEGAGPDVTGVEEDGDTTAGPEVTEGAEEG